MYEILKKEVFSPTLKLMDIKAPEIAKKVQPGQFIILRIDERGERIPLTVADFDRDAGTITIIFQELGYSTIELGKLEVGQFLLDFVGPLGEPSAIKNYGKVVCVAGGVGIAPVFPIARALKEAGNEVINIIGARCEDLLFWQSKMEEAGDRLLVATDDGSCGRKGFVTDILKEVLEEEEIDQVWGVGPVVMMKAVAEVTRPKGIKTMVSMNPIMVDGTGMCGACRVAVGEETKFACVDGPEFDGHLIDWDLAYRRSIMYQKEEKQAMDQQKCGGDCECQS